MYIINNTFPQQLHQELSMLVIQNLDLMDYQARVNGYTVNREDISNIIVYLEAIINFGTWQTTLPTPSSNTVANLITLLNY